MPENEVITPEQPIVETNPLSMDNWKTESQILSEKTTVVDDPVIVEKDKNITEKDEVKKPDEPSKIPGASPHPIQDRPADDNAQPKDEIKKDTDVGKTEPIKFANESSEKIFNALKEGKEEEVAKYFEEKHKLTKAEGADAIKLQLQYANKEFTLDEVNDLFNEKYEFPKKPEQKTTELDEEFDERMEAYKEDVAKVEKQISRDAKIAQRELSKLTQELVLPDIPKLEIAPTEPTQEELDAQKEQVEKFLLSVDEGLKNFNGYTATFKDEEVELPVAYTPTKEEKEALKPLFQSVYSDFPEFARQVGWVDDKGNVNTAKLAQDLHLIQNREKVINSIVADTGNKRNAESIKANKNIDFSGNKRSGSLDASPREKEANMVGHFFNS